MADQTEITPDEITPDEIAPDLEAEGPLEAAASAEGLDDEALERRAEALARILKFGDPVLRSKASPVTDFDDALAAEAERMVAIMRDGMGVGLAATQLGILRRILVFQAGADAPPTALVNPELEWSSERDLATAEEGCLSLPRVVLDVERPLHVIVRGADVTGAPLTIEASGLEARVLQHEIDHLDGVLILQRAPKDQRRGAMRALREGGAYAPPRPEEEREAEAAGEEGRGPAAAGADDASGN
ncbi:MAG: peptide deformylase, partial [Solirubrobacterales bacterium]